jgi:hypothetical protein
LTIRPFVAEWARLFADQLSRAPPMTVPKRLSFILLSLVAIVVALFALYTWAALHISYSEGDREGFLQKFSRKGWICKTWEGEILLSSMPGAIPERFTFSVRDDQVAKDLMAAMGKRVQLTYAQHKGVPSQCFGETEYFVEKVAVSK